MIYASSNGCKRTDKFFYGRRKSLLYSIEENFILIENNTPFYDNEDQIGNNYYFNETPMYLFEKYVPILKWIDHRTADLCYLKNYPTFILEKILKIQNELSIPQNHNFIMRDNYFIKMT
jgi:hypothetical protein